jgi:hypothetical protein
MYVSSAAGVRAGRRWAVVSLLALIALSVAITSARPAHAAIVGDCTPGADWGTLNTAYADQVLALVNQHRTATGSARSWSRRR